MNFIFRAITFLLLLQGLTGCSVIKGMSMLKSSVALQDPNIPFEVTIPVEMKAYMMLVDVSINDSGKRYKFAIDTGAITVLSEKTAQDLQFTEQMSINLKDISGNTKKVKLVTVDKLGISGVEVGSLTAVVVNVDKMDRGIDGILGSNYFQYFSLNIDYHKSSLQLSNMVPPISVDTLVIPFEKNMKFGFAPTLDCTVDGLVIPCMIDTGYSGNFSVPFSKLIKLPAYKNNQFIESDGSLSHGLFGSDKNDIVVGVSQFEMGNISLFNLAMASNHSEDGIMTIGKDFLDNYKVTIDYKNTNLYLTPVLEQSDDKYPIYTYGFGMETDKKEVTRVNGIWKNSPGVKAGIEKGDEIVSINGQRVNKLGMLQLMDLFWDKPEIAVTYISQSGERRKVTVNREDLSKRFSR